MDGLSGNKVELINHINIVIVPEIKLTVPQCNKSNDGRCSINHWFGMNKGIFEIYTL